MLLILMFASQAESDMLLNLAGFPEHAKPGSSSVLSFFPQEGDLCELTPMTLRDFLAKGSIRGLSKTYSAYIVVVDPDLDSPAVASSSGTGNDVALPPEAVPESGSAASAAAADGALNPPPGPEAASSAAPAPQRGGLGTPWWVHRPAALMPPPTPPQPEQQLALLPDQVGHAGAEQQPVDPWDVGAFPAVQPWLPAHGQGAPLLPPAAPGAVPPPGELLPPFEWDIHQHCWFCNLCGRFATADHLRTPMHADRSQDQEYWLNRPPHRGRFAR